MDRLELAGIIFLALLVLALVAVGIYNIRSGLKVLPNAEEVGQEPVWHKQTTILFGINNMVFALLLLLLLLLTIAPGSFKTGVVILIFITIALSILLVARSIFFALRAARKIAQNLREKKKTP
jgi:hypothetical protein